MEKTVTKLEYTEKNHILEVDGTEYAIPQRSPNLEKRIREREEKLKDMSEYEANMLLLEILFGKESAKQMFPEKEVNLDKLSKCAKLAFALYTAEFRTMQMQEMEEKIKAVKPTLDMVDKAGKAIDLSNTKKFVSKKGRK